MLEKGMNAYNFSLSDKDGNIVNLKDFLGKKVIVYFYPKDNTPGCTREACGYRDSYSKYQELGIPVIGISKDSVSSHGKFAEKFGLPFIMLSDPDLDAIKGFGVWKEKKMYGKVSFGVARTTFVIDEQGVIEKVFKTVKPDTNAEDVLNYLAQ